MIEFAVPDFAPYVENVFRFALSLTRDRHLAEDLTQDCFLKAHRYQNQLKTPVAIKPWLFQILVNIWKDNLKKKNAEVYSTVGVEEIGVMQTAEQLAIQNEEKQNILRLMQSLPQQQRSVLYLSTVEQFSNQEISVLLGTTENSVKANLSIARKTMRKKWIAQTRNDIAETR